MAAQRAMDGVQRPGGGSPTSQGDKQPGLEGGWSWGTVGSRLERAVDNTWGLVGWE